MLLQFIATLVLITHLGNVGAGELQNEIPLRGCETSQSSVYKNKNSSLAVDGDPMTWTHTAERRSNQPWWKVDMGASFIVTSVEIINRPSYLTRLGNVHVTVNGRPCGPTLIDAGQLNVMIHCPNQPHGRHLMIELINAPCRGILSLSEVKVFGHHYTEPLEFVKVDLRGHKTIQSSSVYGNENNSTLAVDGDTMTWTHTDVDHSNQPWWAVDLEGNLTVDHVMIHNRPSHLTRLGNVHVTVDGRPCGPKLVDAGQLNVIIYCPNQPRGRYLMIQLLNAPERGILSLSEALPIYYPYPENLISVEPDYAGDVMGLTCNDDQGSPNCTTEDINRLYKTLIANVVDFNIPQGVLRSTPACVHPNALHMFPDDQNVSLGCLTPVGKGWIYFVGHKVVINSISTTFYNNLIKYLARGDKVDASSGYVNYVRANMGYPKGRRVSSHQLQDTDVYVCPANQIDKNVGEFVRKGGILITGGHTPSNFQTIESAFNRVFWKDGAAYRPIFNKNGYVVHPEEKPPVTIQAALDLIKVQETGMAAIFQRVDFETAEALDVLSNSFKVMLGLSKYLGSIPLAASLYKEVTYLLTNNTNLWSISLPINAGEIVPIALLTLQSVLNRVTPKNKKFPIPTMSYWPGPVKQSIPRVTVDVTVDLSYKHIDERFGYGSPASWGIKHTGLYAGPNEKIVITIPKDLIGLFNVRIGLLDDNLWKKKKIYKRFPDPLITESRLSKIETVIYSPYGGQIVFMVPTNMWGEKVMTISGGVEMMTYTYGKTNQATFKASVQEKEFPPFAEYHFNGGVFNLPTDKFNLSVDLDVMGNYWSHVIGAYKHFVNLTIPRDRPEEFACDIQISAGSGHSGYPAMGTLDWADSMFNIVANATSAWGLRHEFGHNYQWIPWMHPGYTETTNNLMSLYFEQSFLNYTRWDHDNVDQLSGPRRHAIRRDWCSKPQSAPPEDIYINLELLVELVDGFGWEPLIKHHGEFARLPANTWLLSTDVKRYDEWFSRLCNILNRDLTPQLVGIWKWPITKQTLFLVERKEYEKWVHPTMSDCKFGA